jgi:hypothetical protein
MSDFPTIFRADVRAPEAPATAVAALEPVTETPVVVVRTVESDVDRSYIETVVELHGKICNAPRITLEMAFLAGELLTKLKKAHGKYGQWMRWRAENMPQVPERNVQRYIQLDDNKDWLREHYKCDTVSDLPVGIRGALEALQDRDKPKAGEVETEEAVSAASDTSRVEDSNPNPIAQDGEDSVQKAIEADDVQVPTPRWNRKIEFAHSYNGVNEILIDAISAFHSADDLMTEAKKGSRVSFKEFSRLIKDTIRELKDAKTELETVAQATGWKDFH